jgi:hypothetical protein
MYICRGFGGGYPDDNVKYSLKDATSKYLRVFHLIPSIILLKLRFANFLAWMLSGQIRQRGASEKGCTTSLAEYDRAGLMINNLWGG